MQQTQNERKFEAPLVSQQHSDRCNDKEDARHHDRPCRKLDRQQNWIGEIKEQHRSLIQNSENDEKDRKNADFCSQAA